MVQEKKSQARKALIKTPLALEEMILNLQIMPLILWVIL
jgi:hypothetical protein